MKKQIMIISLLLISSVLQAEEGKLTEKYQKVVVTGTKSEKTLKDTPIRTQVITEERIKEKGAATLYEILDNEAGIRVEEQCSNCNFSTIRMQGLENYAQILVDGKPLFGGVNSVYGLQQIMAENIQDIEIVKGAGSALYGSDAIAGVINIKLKRPEADAKTIINTNYVDRGEANIGFSASEKIGKIAYSLSGQKSYQNAIDQNNDNFTDQVQKDNVGLNGKLFFIDSLGENSEIYLSGQSTNEFRRGGNLEDDAWDEPFDPDSEHIRSAAHSGTIGFNKTFDNGDDLDLSYTHSNTYRWATNGEAWGAIDPEAVTTIDISDFPRPFIMDETTQVVDLKYAHSLDLWNRLTTGIQYKKGFMAEIIDGEKSNKHSEDSGIFIQNEMNVNNDLEIVLGARYDKHFSEDELINNKYDEEAFSPRVAARYFLNDKSTVRASIGNSFRVPHSFSEDLHLCASAPRISKPANLEAEKATGANLGVDYLSDSLGYDLNLFYTKIEDKIELDQTSPPAGYDGQWSNQGTAYTQGIETGIEKYLSEEISIKLDYTYTDAKYDEERYSGNEQSKYVPRSPKDTAGIRLSYKGKNNGISTTLETEFIGEMFIDHDTGGADPEVEKTDPYSLTNIRVAKILEDKNGVTQTIYLGAKNLFNYIQDERDLDDAAYIWAPLVGRKVYVGMTLEF